MTARDRILQRRGAFIAAAIVGAAGLPACGPTACLEPSVNCDANPNGVVLDAPGKVCVGDRFELNAYQSYCGDGSKPVFATSDPDLLVIDGTTALAKKTGRVTITVLFGTRSATATVDIVSCADASTDSGRDSGTESGTESGTDSGTDADVSVDGL